MSTRWPVFEDTRESWPNLQRLHDRLEIEGVFYEYLSKTTIPELREDAYSIVAEMRRHRRRCRMEIQEFREHVFNYSVSLKRWERSSDAPPGLIERWKRIKLAMDEELQTQLECEEIQEFNRISLINMLAHRPPRTCLEDSPPNLRLDEISTIIDTLEEQIADSLYADEDLNAAKEKRHAALRQLEDHEVCSDPGLWRPGMKTITPREEETKNLSSEDHQKIVDEENGELLRVVLQHLPPAQRTGPEKAVKKVVRFQLPGAVLSNAVPKNKYSP